MRILAALCGLLLALLATAPAHAAIETTGSTVVIQSSANADSQSVTVPGDATAAVFLVGGYRDSNPFSGATVTLGGQSMTLARSDVGVPSPDTYSSAIYVLANPPTGSQTFAWDYAGSDAWGEGAIAFLVFLKGADTSNLVRSSGGQVTDLSASPVTTGSLTAQNGDFALAILSYFTSGTPAWTAGVTAFGDIQDFNSTTSQLGSATVSGNVTITANVVDEESDPIGTYKALTAVVLQPAAATAAKRRKMLMGVGR